MSSSICTQLLDGCAGPPQLLPSGYFDSLQVINLKSCNLIDVETIIVDTICAKRVTGLLPPVDPTDATNKAYVDSLIGALPGPPDFSVQFNDGGTFGGDSAFTWSPGTDTLTVVGTVTGLIAPTLDADAANKKYVDDQIGSVVAPPLTSVQFNDGGAFGGDVDFTFAKGTNTLTVNGTITDGVASLNAGDLLNANDIDANGLIRFTGLTPSTSPTTGTLVVDGGVGIGGTLNVAGNVFGNRFLTTSDVLLKRDITPLNNSLDRLRKIECCSYRLIDDKRGIEQYGVLAQQLETIGLGHLVDNTREFKSVNYINLIAMLIDAVKDLDKKSSKNRLKEISKIAKNITHTNSLKGLESELSDIIDSLKAEKITNLEHSVNVEISNSIQKIDRDVQKPLNLLKKDLNDVKKDIANDVKVSLKKEIVNVDRMSQEISANIKTSVKSSLRNEIKDDIVTSVDGAIQKEFKKDKMAKYIKSNVSSILRKGLEKDMEKLDKDVRDSLDIIKEETVSELERRFDLEITNSVKKVDEDLRGPIYEIKKDLKYVKRDISNDVQDSLKKEFTDFKQIRNEISTKIEGSVKKYLSKRVRNDISNCVDDVIHKEQNKIKDDMISKIRSEIRSEMKKEIQEMKKEVQRYKHEIGHENSRKNRRERRLSKKY